MQKYINLVQSNVSTEPVALKFNQNTITPFVDNASEYQLTVIRFVLPNFHTPLFKFIDDTYKISMTYKTFSVTESVVYTVRSTPDDHSVYEIQHFIDMLNTTLVTAMTNLNVLVTLPSLDAPYFIYDIDSQLISLVATKAYFDENLTYPLRIYLNNTLFKKICGMPVITTAITDKDYQILIQDAKNNTYTTGYYQITQQSSSFDNMVDFNSIVMTTSLPIECEFTGQAYGIPILSDYCPTDMTIKNFYNNITYNATYNYRQANLVSNSPIYNFDINCYWSDKAGILTPLKLPVNNSANIKIMLCKKQ